MKRKKITKKLKKGKTTMKKISDNQLESLDQWLAFYKEHQKLPHKRVVCSHCKSGYASMKGLGLAHAKKNFNNDINRILTESLCKECKNESNMKIIEKIVLH